MPNSSPADRNYWYEAVRQYFEENNIPWTTWDYQGTFGLFNKGSNELFDHDLNVYLLKALNFNVPPQTPLIIKPDSAGFPIYSDYIGHKIFNVSSGSGIVNFYSPEMPNNDNYCLYWHGFSQYDKVGFDFNPDRDFSRLTAEGYALDFMVRGNISGIKFDVRFLDTKTADPGDHPWRMGVTIDETYAAWDRKWHHVNIPLSDLEEKGSWDNNTWYFPAGKFDWSAIDRLEISMEESGTAGKHIWFDNIHITDVDSATVREFGEVGVETVSDHSPLKLEVMPNPVIYSASISYTLPAQSHVNLSIYTLTGIKICTLAEEIQEPGDKVFNWDGRTDAGAPLQKGIYLCTLTADGLHGNCKIIKY